MRIARSILVAGVLVALAACQREEATPASTAPAAETPAASAPAATGTPATPAATAPATPPAAGTPPSDTAMVGVAECDDYLTKYEACLTEHVPESARAAMQQSMEATRAGWRQAVASPGGRESLAAACRQMAETSRQTMQAYGCTDF